MKFEDQFEEFLENRVNLSDGRINRLNEKVSVVERLFESLDPASGLVMVGSEPQGSYAQKTIINPLNDDHGFDADLLVEFENFEGNPKDLVLAVRRALNASPSHRDLVGLKNRCVTLDYAGEFHLDVVPSVKIGGAASHIANRADNTWEPTDPQGFTGWIEERNELARGYLVPVIRLIKYHRALKDRPKAKSVVLSYLLAERAGNRAPEDFTDLPTTLVLLLEDLAAWCSLCGEIAPNLTEPTCSAQFRLDDIKWDAFTRQMQRIADRARIAYDEQEQGRSLALWRKLFGDKFPAPGPVERRVTASTAPGEMDLLGDLGIPTLIEDETVEIASNVRPTGDSPGGSIESFGLLPKERRLTFAIARTSVTPPFDVYWKVKNSGDEAERCRQLRGEITEDLSGLNAYREETTRYRGAHYVEVYIVKEGVCVARRKQDVVIG